MRTLKELREFAESMPTPELDWDKVAAMSDLLNPTLEELIYRRQLLEELFEQAANDQPYTEVEYATALMADRIVESYVLERVLRTAKAVIDVTT